MMVESNHTDEISESDRHFILVRLLLQMGGPAGVMASEHVLMTVSPSKGMKMHAMPRKV